MEKDSAFEERSKLIEMQSEADKIKHNFRMEELAYERETNKLFHDWALERERIKRAENRKDYQDKKAFGSGFRH